MRGNDILILNTKPKVVETYVNPILRILRIVRVQERQIHFSIG